MALKRAKELVKRHGICGNIIGTEKCAGCPFTREGKRRALDCNPIDALAIATLVVKKDNDAAMEALETFKKKDNAYAMEALELFKKQYPTVTSGDLQSFILGWTAAAEKYN